MRRARPRLGAIAVAALVAALSACTGDASGPTGAAEVTLTADCPGEPRLRVTDAVLHLLADATPVEVTRQVSG